MRHELDGLFIWGRCRHLLHARCAYVGVRMICVNCGSPRAREDGLCDHCYTLICNREAANEDAKRRHDELASERAAGRKEEREAILAMLEEMRQQTSWAALSTDAGTKREAFSVEAAHRHAIARIKERT